MNRRAFLKRTGLAAGLGIAGGGATLGKTAGVSIVLDPDDAIASAEPVRRAVGELKESLSARGVPVRLHPRLAQAAAGDFCLLAAGATNRAARGVLASAGAAMPQAPECVGLAAGTAAGRRVLLACGSDVRGLVYAVLELKDRVACSADPLAALDIRKPIIERPANRIRSIARCFVSDVEDKPWFYDRAMWPQYLSLLAAQRFNRFSLTLGIGYDFLTNIRDCYFHFAYPFLAAVPGYDVRAEGLPGEERERNLEMLRFISNETAARGLHFQLGLWTHGYEWTNSPQANYTIRGLTPENHAAYCRDALRVVLEACPAIGGVTFRVHGESGVAEGSNSFWKTVFEGIVRCGRMVEIDMHAKGIDAGMIEVALSTGLPVNVSPKYWAEHMGLPYHQAAIRELEMPPREAKDKGFFALSSGSRRFMRYGYGDLLTAGRRYGVLHRMWPGTQRLLLWGDPAMAAAYGRASSFCGSAGVELCEPLSFKGRKGSGIAGGRCAYADASLQPRWDWEKHLYTYRVWGRLLYNPDAEPDTWRRLLRQQLADAAEPAEAALAAASRILPLMTTAHLPSAANNNYWPEMYTNMPIVDAARKHPYGDSPSPKRFGTVSPLDPELFSRVDDFAQELLSGDRTGKYSPLEVSDWLEQLAGAASKHLGLMQQRTAAGASADFRRLATDVAIQAGLGRFFAFKLRSAVRYALYERSGDRSLLKEALATYASARDEWEKLANQAKGIYASDVTFGFDKHMRGHWLDRLAAIDEDIADMRKRLEGNDAKEPGARNVDAERLKQALARPKRPAALCKHEPAASFRPGQPLAIELFVQPNKAGAAPISARLHYRHVNQAERYRVEEMKARDNRYRAVIPADYTASPYALLYFFEIHEGPEIAWIYPGLGPNLCHQPYFVIPSAGFDSPRINTDKHG